MSRETNKPELLDESMLHNMLKQPLDQVTMPESVAYRTMSAISETTRTAKPRAVLVMTCALVLLVLLAGVALAVAYLPDWIRNTFRDEQTAGLLEKGYGAATMGEAEANGLRMTVDHLIVNGNQLTSLVTLERTKDSMLPTLRNANPQVEGLLMMDGKHLSAYGEGSDWYDETTGKRHLLIKSEFYDESQNPIMIPADAEVTLRVAAISFPNVGVAVLCPATEEGIKALPLNQELAPAGSAADSLKIHNAEWAADTGLLLRYTLVQKNKKLDVVYGEEEYEKFQTSRLAVLMPAPEGGYVLDRDESWAAFSGDFVDATLSAKPVEGGVLAMITDPQGEALWVRDPAWCVDLQMPEGAKSHEARIYPINQQFVYQGHIIIVDSLTLRAGAAILNYHYKEALNDLDFNCRFELTVGGATLEATPDGGGILRQYGSARFYQVAETIGNHLSLRVADGNTVLGEWTILE